MRSTRLNRTLLFNAKAISSVHQVKAEKERKKAKEQKEKRGSSLRADTNVLDQNGEKHQLLIESVVLYQGKEHAKGGFFRLSRSPDGRRLIDALDLDSGRLGLPIFSHRACCQRDVYGFLY
jgi:hypothetical protein